MTAPTRTQAGHTMIETLLSVAVLTLLGGGLFTLLDGSDDLFHTSLRGGKARQDSTRALDVLRQDVQMARLSTLRIDRQDPHADALEYQTPLSLAGGEIVWGATRLEAGALTEYPNHSVRIQVVAKSSSRQLVRRIVDPDGVVVGQDEVVSRHVDTIDPDGAAAFQASLSGRYLTLKLRLRYELAKEGRQDDLTRSQSLLLRLRNP